MSRPREFHFSDSDFENIRTRIKSMAGIQLADHKREMVYSRLARRLRHYGFNTFEKYLELLINDEQELINFVNSLTTNLTSFFREGHHFEYLEKKIVPELLQLHKTDKKIRIWISANSTGEEAYSTAISLCESIPNWKQWDIKILATDLDTNVIESSKSGIYSIDRIEGIPENLKKKYFLRGKGGNADKCKVISELRDLIHFSSFNLIEKPWSLMQEFDVIFCRNVLIYFDRDTQQQVLESMLNLLKHEGHLFLGHSESIGDFKNCVEHEGRTWFRKIRKGSKTQASRL